ncbi:transposase [Halomonas aquamarina]|nr:transposase [Halomonas aquamarina]
MPQSYSHGRYRHGYLGIQKRDEHKHRNDVSWYIAKRPGTRQKRDARRQKVEKIKASIRAKMEHPFRYIKHVFGYGKARYRGLAKNTQRLTYCMMAVCHRLFTCLSWQCHCARAT